MNSTLNSPSANSKVKVTHRVVKGVAWTLLGTGASRFLTGISSIVIARLLGPKNFGEYGIVQSTVYMFATYGAFRMGNTAVKYVSQYRATDPLKAARVLRMALFLSACLCGIMALVLLALSPQIASRVLQHPELSPCLMIGAAYLFFLTYGSIVQQTFAGFENFKMVSAVATSRAALMATLCIPMALIWGVKGALSGLVLSAAIVLPQALRWLRREAKRNGLPKKVPLKGAFAETPLLWQFALPGFLVLAVMSGANWIGRVMVTRHGGVGELGLFEAAGQWSTLVYFIPMIATRVVMPILSASDGADATSDYRHAFSLQFRTVLMSTGPVTVLLIGFAHVLAFVYGHRFVGVEPLMPILFTAGFIRTLNESLRIVYESKGRQWAAFRVYIVWAALLIGVTMALVTRLGAFGFGLGALAAELGLLLVSAAQVDLYLAPGLLRTHAGIAFMMFGLVLAAHIAHDALAFPWSAAICVCVAGVASVPLLRQLRSPQTSEFLGRVQLKLFAKIKASQS